jgi:hypothetical protein
MMSDLLMDEQVRDVMWIPRRCSGMGPREERTERQLTGV